MLKIGHKLEKRQWHQNLPTWSNSQTFWRCFVSFVKFSYWFHVNIITLSGAKAIFFYKRLIRNPEIGNSTVSVWVLRNIWQLDQVRNTKFGTNESWKIPGSHLPKYHLPITVLKNTRVIKQKRKVGGGGESGITSPPPPVRLIPNTWKDNNFLPSLYFTMCVVKRYSITEKQRSAYNSLLLISILQITLKNIKKILQVEDIYETFDRLQNWRNLKLQNLFSIFYVFS